MTKGEEETNTKGSLHYKRLGLFIPMSRVTKEIRKRAPEANIQPEAATGLARALQYVLEVIGDALVEIPKLYGEELSDIKRIMPRHLLMAASKDPEMAALFENITIPGAGTLDSAVARNEAREHRFIEKKKREENKIKKEGIKSEKSDESEAPMDVDESAEPAEEGKKKKGARAKKADEGEEGTQKTKSPAREKKAVKKTPLKSTEQTGKGKSAPKKPAADSESEGESQTQKPGKGRGKEKK